MSSTVVVILRFAFMTVRLNSGAHTVDLRCQVRLGGRLVSAKLKLRKFATRRILEAELVIVLPTVLAVWKIAYNRKEFTVDISFIKLL